ncbi:hypothetical protein A33Q_0993 [Indibacter alkaliphilus LW1]|uniref:Membrane protein YfhO n=1 Tax=Indibacter alkaliphilus (strain CCUG 57479 / KCTC 22604 / LW1) TaxID=1189612 RepID=S2DH70_INDAL|nr:membrane protein [Indibacter alkaliphilus]EOZ98339.1 hypothetical protein A33Q_0993 [Indibacter alkaliphilus LW1]
MRYNIQKQVLPHFIGVVIFYLIVLFYFSPAVFDGKIIFQYDILQWEGASKEILDYRKETGDEALWTNRLFGGMPAYLVSFEVPGDITNFLTKIITPGLPHPVNSLFVGMVAMYILLLSFKIRPEFSIASAVAFAFNTFHIISLDAGHNAKIWAICLIPLILAGIHLAFEGKKWLGLALFAFGLLLQLKFNHLQITYYTVIIVLVYGIGRLFQFYKYQQLPQFGKVIGVLLIGLILAVGGNLSRFMTVLEYGKYSTRGQSNLSSQADSQDGLDKDYAFNWSQGKLETLTLLVPNLYGPGSTKPFPKDPETERVLRANNIDLSQVKDNIDYARKYWGDQPGTGGPIYGSAIMILLLILGIIYAPKTFKVVFASIATIGIILAWGKNLDWLNYFLFDYMPGYNKFRAVTMALSMSLFAIPVLGALGLEYLFRSNAKSEAKKSLFIAFGCSAGIALVFWLFAGVFNLKAPFDDNFPEWLVDALKEDRKAILRASALKSFMLILIASGLIWASLQERVSPKITGLTLALIVILDLWIINKLFLNEDAFQFSPSEQFFAKTPADETILRDQDYFRVLNINNPFNDARTSYYFNSVGGYHGAKMKRYQELIENALNPEIQSFIAKAQEGDFDWMSLNVLNMLNTKYIMAGRTENAVFQNPQANGSAWFPASIEQVNSNEEEMELIKSRNTKAFATVNKSEFGEVAAGEGQVELQERKPSELQYSVNAQKAGLLVFSEIYYPIGWKATVNGEEKEIIRTNYLLRGIEVPEGQSIVNMSFEPASYYSTKTIVVIFQYLTVLLLLGAIFISVRNSTKS